MCAELNCSSASKLLLSAPWVCRLGDMLQASLFLAMSDQETNTDTGQATLMAVLKRWKYRVNACMWPMISALLHTWYKKLQSDLSTARLGLLHRIDIHVSLRLWSSEVPKTLKPVLAINGRSRSSLPHITIAGKEQIINFKPFSHLWKVQRFERDHPPDCHPQVPNLANIYVHKHGDSTFCDQQTSPFPLPDSQRCS